jgi:hypothetical protein
LNVVQARVLLLIWLLVFGLQIAIYVFVPPVVLLVVLTFVYLLPGVAANSSGYASLILSLLNFDTSKYVWTSSLIIENL